MSVRKHHELKPCVSKFSFCSYFNKLKFIHPLTSFNKAFKGLINVVFWGKSYKAIVLNIVASRSIISKHNGLRDLCCLIIFAGQESMPGLTECFFFNSVVELDTTLYLPIFWSFSLREDPFTGLSSGYCQVLVFLGTASWQRFLQGKWLNGE